MLICRTTAKEKKPSYSRHIFTVPYETAALRRSESPFLFDFQTDSHAIRSVVVKLSCNTKGQKIPIMTMPLFQMAACCFSCFKGDFIVIVRMRSSMIVRCVSKFPSDRYR